MHRGRAHQVAGVCGVLLALSACSSADPERSSSTTVAPATSLPVTTTEPMEPGPCRTLGEGGPLEVTAACDDPLLGQPVDDVDEQRTTTDPASGVTVSYRYVHGSFAGTGVRYAFAFPAADTYEGRFFQSTYPTNAVEDATPATIAFAITHGAYVVSTNNNGGLPAGIPLAAYRANAAAAKHSRTVAARVYGSDAPRPRGYLYGASGGAYQTVGAVESTRGVWDGSVPIVPGTPNAIPSNQVIALLGLRVLHDKLPQIVDALEPGGSGDPFAGLDVDERQALEEVSRLGFPLHGWWQHQALNGGDFAVVEGGARALDPTYVDDFWSQPGYEGQDPAVQAARFQRDATVAGLVPGITCAGGDVIGTQCPTGGIELTADVPGDLLMAADLVVTSGAATDARFTIASARDRTVYVTSGDLTQVRPGDSVRIDNSAGIAFQHYARHQVPTPDMYGWNQYRDGAGQPRAPQRPLLVGTTLASATGGAPATGRFHGKMIMVGSVDDVQAFAWSSDWYAVQAAAVAGSPIDDRFRLWFLDDAGHTEPRSTYAATHIVDYTGAVQQALLDLDDWVATGTAPAASTSYRVDDLSQVLVPPTASERKGIQPAVTLTVDGRDRVEVGVGEAVELTATAEVPDGGGHLVQVEWDLVGTGRFGAPQPVVAPDTNGTFTATHRYDAPGTYFAVARITARRDGTHAPYGAVQDLARVRVVVR